MASYESELGKADVLSFGSDVTLIGWGTQVHVLREVAEKAKKELKVKCELIDLVSLLPWDKETVCNVSYLKNNTKTEFQLTIFSRLRKPVEL